MSAPGKPQPALRVCVFAARSPSLHLPLSTLGRHPCSCRPMTRGQRGSLLLHCSTLSFVTPRRFHRRTRAAEPQSRTKTALRAARSCVHKPFIPSIEPVLLCGSAALRPQFPGSTNARDERTARTARKHEAAVESPVRSEHPRVDAVTSSPEWRSHFVTTNRCVWS
jgi:hypothetical protein